MWFRTSLDSLNRRSTPPTIRRTQRAAERRRQARRLLFEGLEERSLLAFDLAVPYPVGANPQAIVSADFNGGGLDLAVVNYNDSTVSVLVGNADGTFQSAQNSATGLYPRSLAVGDFDGDGNTDDVATVNNYDVSILLGNGDGTLLLAGTVSLPPQTVPGASDLPQYPLSVAVGDLTGDGLLDLAVTAQTSYTTRNGPYTCYDYWWNPYNCYTYETHTNGHVNVLIGDGAGTFTPPAADAVQLLEGSYPISVALEELDSLPGLDLATADYYGGQVHVLSGNNNGTFDAPVDYSTNWNPTSVLTGDVNNDGISDLVTANYYSASVLLGNGSLGVGDGTFQPAQNTALNYYATSLAVGDFDADGKLDLVATSNYYEGQVDVLLGHGNGTFGAPRTSTVGSYLTSVVTGDFNGDEFPDVAVTDANTYDVSVLINDQYWPPTPPPSVSINDVAVSEGNTGTTDATFTIYLSAASDQDITVHYETADGSATAGSDYTGVSGVSGDVTIPAGETTYSVTIAVTGDRVWESTEDFFVNLSAPVNATIGDGQGIGTIYDDEPLVYIGDATVTEGTGTSSVNATFTVWLSATSDVDVTVHYDTATGTATAGDDFTGGSGDVIIPHDQYSQTFTVAVLGDRLAEPTETYFVNLSAPVNAGIGDNQGVGTILDNEPRISINNVSKKEGNGHTTLFVFTVTLLGAYNEPVTVNYATAAGTATAGSDYQTKNGTLTFAPGVTSMTITIIAIKDKNREPNETFFVNLSGASSNALISDDQGIGTILNDDKR